MDQIEENLAKYLEIESILNSLFDATDFCRKHCILTPENKKLPVAGCCRDKYYKTYDLDHPAFSLLKAKREKLYGAPEKTKWVKRISPCEYHTLSGCVLHTHKSPICLSFLCRKGIDFLREQFEVFTYDYLGMNYALEWILTGDLSGSAYEAFEKSCLGMVEKILSNPPAQK